MFEVIIKDLCLTLTQSLYQISPLNPRPDPEKIILFVLRQINQMPDYLRFPLKILTWVFSIFSLTKGSYFQNLSTSDKKKCINNWRHSSVGAFRDFIRLFDTLTRLAYYSEIK